jgi:catechol 2,3-dioxygenase-like lactoylglutathione lyase family enzyme
MLEHAIPKLPMRNKAKTLDFYTRHLDFACVSDYPDYLIIRKDTVELHFFAFADLDPASNYGQIYVRTSAIDTFYQHLIQKGAPIHPNGALTAKPWGQKEFSMLDPDNNLLTFGQAL